LIKAPRSTHNNDGKRDPWMPQTNKGNQGSHETKVDIGVDKNSGLIQSALAMTATVHDLIPAAERMHSDEGVADSDSDNQSIGNRVLANV